MESMLPTLLYVAIFFVIIYFFMIRPDKKRRKQQEEMRNSLKAGDVITTVGGIMGTVVDLTDNSIVIETSEDRVRMEIARWAVGTIGKSDKEVN